MQKHYLFFLRAILWLIFIILHTVSSEILQKYQDILLYAIYIQFLQYQVDVSLKKSTIEIWETVSTAKCCPLLDI